MVTGAAGGTSLGDRSVSEQGVDGGVPLRVTEAGSDENIRLTGPAVAGADCSPNRVQCSGVR
jgi:hypothetical protein